MARSSLKNIARLIQSTQESIPVEQSFLADLQRSIELQNKKTAREPSKTYKPSSMQCIRNMYYQVTGTQQDDNESSCSLVGICNSGTDIHARLQQAVLDMKTNGMDCEYVNVEDFVRTRGLNNLQVVKSPDFNAKDYETKLFDKRLNISFLCDGIIRYKNKYYILELKTESTNKFMMRKGVDTKHYDQGTAYSILFNLENVIFIYVNRDVHNMKSYMFTPTQQMKQDLLDRISECDAFVLKNQVPPKPDVDSRVCNYCNYRLKCEGDV